MNHPRFDRSKGVERLEVKGGRRPGEHVARKEQYHSRKDGGEGFVGSRFFMEMVGLKKQESASEEVEFIRFFTKEEDRNKLRKAFVGEVIFPDSAYTIQISFELEGYFAIKVTPMGSKLCVLGELESGEILDLIREGETWWKQ